MQIRQRFVVAYPREVVWEYFGRLDEVTRCMPGASLTEPVVGNHAKFKLVVKVGPISAAFAGESEFERDAERFCGMLRGNARDTRGDSRVKGVVEYALAEEADAAGTGVDVSVDFTLSGRLAQFSRAGIVNDLAARLTADFAKNLAAALAAETPSSAEELSGTAPAPEPAPVQSASELNAGRLVLSVIWARIVAFLKSIFGRG